MSNEKDAIKNDDRLSKIADHIGSNKKTIIGMICLVVVVISSIYFYSKPSQKAQESEEEIYTIPGDYSIENKHEQPTEKIEPINNTESKPQVSQEIVQQQIMLIQEKQKELQQRLSAPLMLVNASQSNNPVTPTQSTQLASKDANTQFMNQVTSQNPDAATATLIGSLNYIVAEGRLIHGILESATNSDLPGYLRAIVSEPVYSEDGTQVLIPRGSRLIGQYKSGMLQGQSRIFIVWTRLITPNGISVHLGSAGIDSLGVAGMGADEIDRHFWERFGTASLLSLIGAGAANAGVEDESKENSASIYRSAVASSFAQSADQSLQHGSRVAPTLKTYQGKPIMVFVAKDLNFQSAIKMVSPKKNIF